MRDTTKGIETAPLFVFDLFYGFFILFICVCVFVSFLYNIFIGNAFVILMVRASMT